MQNTVIISADDSEKSQDEFTFERKKARNLN